MFRVLKHFTSKKRKSRFSLESLLSHSTEKHGGGTLPCSTIFFVSKILINKRRGKGRRVYHDLQSKLFCLRNPEIFVEEPFCFSQNFFGKQKLYGKEGGRKDYHDTLYNFCLTVPKKFVCEPFSVSL